MITRTKKRAQKYGREVIITYEDLLPLPTHCSILGLELVYRSKKLNDKKQAQGEAASASLDRIDSTRGYVPGNVRIISWRANTLRNNGTYAEMEAVARDLEAYEAFPY